MLNRGLPAWLVLAAIWLTVAPLRGQGSEDPDRLYQDRENPASARAAAEIWRRRSETVPADLESRVKFAQACYWMGTNGPDAAAGRKRWLEDGVAAARLIIGQAPQRPEGHFWLAANMGALAESFGSREGLRYRRPTREALETVLKLDPGFLQGSADRALGRWYAKVPGMFGGDKTRAEQHLRRALAGKPDSIITLVFLAEVLIDRDRKDEARTLLQTAVATAPDPDSAPEDRRFKSRASELLASLTSSNAPRRR